jgi:hypothetical protein
MTGERDDLRKTVELLQDRLKTTEENVNAPPAPDSPFRLKFDRLIASKDEYIRDLEA